MSGETYQCACGNITVVGALATNIKTTLAHARGSFDPQTPIVQIHKCAISIANFAQVNNNVMSNRQVEFTCLECGYRLLLHASRKGAFCQFREPTFSAVCGSLPPDSFLSQDTKPGGIPRAMRLLFKQRDSDLFDIASDELDASGARSSQENDSADYDLMFSNSNEPLVGSYSEVGTFTTENDYLIFME